MPHGIRIATFYRISNSSLYILSYNNLYISQQSTIFSLPFFSISNRTNSLLVCFKNFFPTRKGGNHCGFSFKGRPPSPDAEQRHLVPCPLRRTSSKTHLFSISLFILFTLVFHFCQRFIFLPYRIHIYVLISLPQITIYKRNRLKNPGRVSIYKV